MRKLFSAVLLGMGVLFASAPAVAERADLDFTLINKTGYTISEVYVSSVATDDWEEDVMGRDELGNGERVHITFGKRSKGCEWDMMVVYDDGEEAVWHALDLCTISAVTLRYSRKDGSTWAETE